MPFSHKPEIFKLSHPTNLILIPKRHAKNRNKLSLLNPTNLVDSPLSSEDSPEKALNYAVSSCNAEYLLGTSLSVFFNSTTPLPPTCPIS
jgi:hypothetical protein